MKNAIQHHREHLSDLRDWSSKLDHFQAEYTEAVERLNKAEALEAQEAKITELLQAARGVHRAINIHLHFNPFK